MSHTTKLKGTVIRNIEAMRAAIAELAAQGVAVELVEKAKPRMYYQNQHGVCEYVVRLPNSRFDVGLDLQEDGSYVPVFDTHANLVGQHLGADVNVCPVPRGQEGQAAHQIGKLMQSYAKHAAMQEAAAQGYIVENSYTDDKGQVHLVLAGY
jgi:hypothetical protein